MWGQVQSRVLLIIPVAGAIIPRVERLTLGRQVALSSHTFHPWQSLGPGILTLRYMPRFLFFFFFFGETQSIEGLSLCVWK